MRGRSVAGVFVALVGIAAPVVAIALLYGFDTRIHAREVPLDQMLAMLGSTAVAFAAGLITSWLLRSGAPTIGQVMRDTLRDAATPSERVSA